MANPFLRLTWFLSKTDQEVIQSTTRWTQLTQSALGFAVLITGLLAWVSGSYTLNTVFNNVFASGLMGVLYAGAIMNIDREIVSYPNYEGMSAVRKWSVAGSRCLLAGAIGVVLAVPIELRLFEGRINERLESEARQKNAAAFAARDTVLGVHLQALTRSQSALDTARSRRRQLQQEISQEVAGVKTTTTSGIYGEGPVLRRKMEERDYLDGEITRLTLEYDAQAKLASAVRSQADSAFQQREVHAANDFLARYLALDGLKADYAGVRRAALGITILLVLLELIPAVAKVMLPPSDYDELLRSKILIGSEEAIVGWNTAKVRIGGPGSGPGEPRPGG
jgi:hypothetical protein